MGVRFCDRVLGFTVCHMQTARIGCVRRAGSMSRTFWILRLRSDDLANFCFKHFTPAGPLQSELQVYQLVVQVSGCCDYAVPCRSETDVIADRHDASARRAAAARRNGRIPCKCTACRPRHAVTAFAYGSLQAWSVHARRTQQYYYDRDRHRCLVEGKVIGEEEGGRACDQRGRRGGGKARRWYVWRVRCVWLRGCAAHLFVVVFVCARACACVCVRACERASVRMARVSMRVALAPGCACWVR